MQDMRRAIRNQLSDNRLSFVWLIEQLRLRGIVTDKTELSSIFAGTRSGPKVENILTTSAQILSEYEILFVENAVK